MQVPFQGGSSKCSMQNRNQNRFCRINKRPFKYRKGIRLLAFAGRNQAAIFRIGIDRTYFWASLFFFSILTGCRWTANSDFNKATLAPQLISRGPCAMRAFITSLKFAEIICTLWKRKIIDKYLRKQVPKMEMEETYRKKINKTKLWQLEPSICLPIWKII